ncbi:MAG TPA: class I SAM-dependent RNA methyltransferase [Chitinophagales bacterium]
MRLYNTQSRIIITCSKRLSSYLEQEVRALGFEPTRVFVTGVEMRGTLQDCIKLNLNLRCASQVLFGLADFFCDSPDDLYKRVNSFPWENILPMDSYFSVTSNVDHPSMNTPLFANVKIKDGIVDRFRTRYGKRPNSGNDNSQAVISLFWKETQATLFIDTSGETLTKHGYRKIPGKAPMVESLAAATLLATKWDRKNPFINPMCGSGTLAIEAALLATNRKPGLLRKNYSFMYFKGFEDEMYEQELAKIQDEITEVPDLKIIATDISEDAVNIAQINAKIAGVADYITFAECDFADTEIPEQNLPTGQAGGGILFLNPEYGERLGEETELEKTYERIGDFMKQKVGGYTGYIFTGNMELAKKIGLKTTRRIEFYNSKIDCRLLEFELYEGSKRQPKI